MDSVKLLAAVLLLVVIVVAVNAVLVTPQATPAAAGTKPALKVVSGGA